MCILQGFFFISNRYEIPFVYYGAKPQPVNSVLYKPIQGNKKWVYFYFFLKPHNLVACLFYWIRWKAGRALDTWEPLSGSLMNTTFIQKKINEKSNATCTSFNRCSDSAGVENSNGCVAPWSIKVYLMSMVTNHSVGDEVSLKTKSGRYSFL